MKKLLAIVLSAFMVFAMAAGVMAAQAPEGYTQTEVFEGTYGFGDAEVTAYTNDDFTAFYLTWSAFDEDQVLEGTVDDGIVEVTYDETGFMTGDAQLLWDDAVASAAWEAIGGAEEGAAAEAAGTWIQMDLSLERPTLLTDSHEFERGGEVYYDGETGDYYLYKASTWDIAQEDNVPVFTYYTEYASEEEAKQAAEDAGLISCAEALGAIVIVATSAGEEYTDADIEIYKAMEQFLLNEHLHEGTKSFGPGIVVENYYTYTQRDFVLADSPKAANFLAGGLTSYLNRIPAMLIIGADAEVASTDVPVAAYLVDCSEATVEGFKTMDNATEEIAEGIFVNPSEAAQKVVVTSGKSLSEALDDFWNEIGVSTWRQCYTSMLYAPEGKATEDVFSLTKIIFPEELGVQEDFIEWDGETVHGTFVYTSDYVRASEGEVFPAIFVFHGGGTPGDVEAKGDGYVTLAGNENVIIVSLDYDGLSAGEDNDFVAQEDRVGNGTAEMKALYDYVVENYPIDVTRVFATGFSMGGATSSYFAERYGDLLAGYITMHSNAAHADVQAMPYMYMTGTKDEASIDTTELIRPTLDHFAKVNNIQDIDFSELDTDKEKLYGVPEGVGERESFVVNGENIETVTLFNAAGQPTMKLAAAEGVVHYCHGALAPVIWDYMKQFSLVDGVRYINGEEIIVE